jgi:hypothetical protein
MARRSGSPYRSSNRHKEFLRAAKRIAARVSTIDGVVGILGTGCIGRGHCDDYSDLDLIVYAHRHACRDLDKNILIGGIRYKGIELDTPVECYEKALAHKSPSKYWSQVMRWDRENSIILYDTRNRIRDLLRRKLVFPDSEQRRIMARQEEKVADRLVYEFELWKRRGRPLNLALVLMHAVEHILLWIYARNKKFQPYLDKWLFYHLETRAVPEAGYLDILRQPFIGSVRTVAEAERMRADLLDLVDRLGIQLEYRSVRELQAENEENWRKASERTRYYLGW